MATNVSANKSAGAIPGGCFSLFASNPDEKYGHLIPARGPIKIIDVVNEYPWTVNEIANRPETPCVELIEYQVGTSMLIMQLNYYRSKLGDDIVGEVVARGTNFVGGLSAAITPGGTSFGQGFSQALSAVLPGTPGEDLTGKNIDPQPLNGLYQAVPTGFHYNFPYFDKTLRGINNTWSSEQSVLSSITNVADAFSQAAGTGNLAQNVQTFRSLASSFGTAMEAALPNAKIEMPEYWNGTQISNIPVKFTLLNTVSYEQTIKNWELVFLLTHQTLHFRKNFVVNHSPCIYQINIPGVAYYPVGSITNFKVAGLGTTRKISICGSDKLIPEAYEIALELVPLIQDSRNRNNYNLTGNKQDLVRVINRTTELSQAEFESQLIPIDNVISNIDNTINTGGLNGNSQQSVDPFATPPTSPP